MTDQVHLLRTTGVDKSADVLRELVDCGSPGGASAGRRGNIRAGEEPDIGIPVRSAEE